MTSYYDEHKEQYKVYRRNYYLKNKDKVNKEAKKWHDKNPIRVKEIIDKMRTNLEYKNRRAIAQVKYFEKYPEKVRAQHRLGKAVRKGKIVKLACQVCGNLLSQAHHPDYTKPFNVWWLCIPHHRLADKGKLVLFSDNLVK